MKIETSFFSIVSSVSVMVVLVYVSFVPFGLSFGSPTIIVVFSVTSRLNVSSSRRRDVPGVCGDENPSDDFDGDVENFEPTFFEVNVSSSRRRDVPGVPRADFEGDENPSDVLEGDDANRVVVVVDVVDLRGDRDLLEVSTLMFFSLKGLRMGTVGSPAI